MEFKVPEFRISLKMKGEPTVIYRINCSEDIVHVARKCFEADQIEWVESFVAVALNRTNEVIGFYKVSQGGITATIADPRVIFQFALLSNATSIIIAHNHPSGNLKPSSSDVLLTQKIKQAGEVLDIKLLDHIIVTAGGYYSFSDEGML